MLVFSPAEPFDLIFSTSAPLNLLLESQEDIAALEEQLIEQVRDCGAGSRNDHVLVFMMH